MKNIILIGMPTTGKSTVGVILAKMLGYDFIDTDILLALDQKRPLPQIISEDGYDRFIELEGKVGKGVKTEKTVIATGGSMVFSEDAMKSLSESGIVVWLDTSVSELENRLIGSFSDRGIAAPAKMSLSEIFKIRAPLYEKYADVHILCEGTTEMVASNLRERFINEKLI